MDDAEPTDDAVAGALKEFLTIGRMHLPPRQVCEPEQHSFPHHGRGQQVCRVPIPPQNCPLLQQDDPQHVWEIAQG
eukprot:CAMPEP_0184359584 /NCGR_PEP_ID=MMETSP1089-20130417/120775_1 /TAXON_ID=38269 ORGANISM="Gloeochaete wittrockiana, Strain SAG46.84" /NCGR_SAMPLE_ID=MMETSP1089 /ASSEMBLY_ACC=CAM_ASM_000445 /LENGTH=75 /DNA_ID=CAMNT_0026698441 /DNA_START=349 /DNA_END=576 /DNA_ORIENTATION=+